MRRGSSRALLARYRRLRDPDSRRRNGRFAAEGVRCLITALESRARVLEIVYCPLLLRSAAGRRAVRELARQGVPAEKVDPETFRALSTLQRASGVAMILREGWIPLARLPPGSTPVHVALRTVRSHGNLGTLLRTLEAVAGGALIVLGDRVDPFRHDVVRGSMGTVLRRPIARTDDAALRRWARARGLRVIGASPRAGAPYDGGCGGDTPLLGPLVLVLGDERRGLSDGDRALCDGFVHIPMFGRVDSLNLGVSGSLLLYEAFRARRAAAGGELTE